MTRFRSHYAMLTTTLVIAAVVVGTFKIARSSSDEQATHQVSARSAATAECPAAPASNSIQLETQPHSMQFVMRCYSAVSTEPLKITFKNNVTPVQSGDAIPLRLVVLPTSEYEAMVTPNDSGVSYMTTSAATFVAQDAVAVNTPPGSYTLPRLDPGRYTITTVPPMADMSADLEVS